MLFDENTAIIHSIIYIYKVVICVCLSVCLIISQKKTLDRYASNFYWGTWETHGNVLSVVFSF